MLISELAPDVWAGMTGDTQPQIYLHALSSLLFHSHTHNMQIAVDRGRQAADDVPAILGLLPPVKNLGWFAAGDGFDLSRVEMWR